MISDLFDEGHCLSFGGLLAMSPCPRRCCGLQRAGDRREGLGGGFSYRDAAAACPLRINSCARDVADSSQRAAEPGDLPPEEQADHRPMGHAGEERPAPRCTDHRLDRRVHPSGQDQALFAAGARRRPRRYRVNAVCARSHPGRDLTRAGPPDLAGPAARSSPKSGSNSLKPSCRLRGRAE